jgi:hypothetical protein
MLDLAEAFKLPASTFLLVTALYYEILRRKQTLSFALRAKVVYILWIRRFSGLNNKKLT